MRLFLQFWSEFICCKIISNSSMNVNCTIGSNLYGQFSSNLIELDPSVGQMQTEKVNSNL